MHVYLVPSLHLYAPVACMGTSHCHHGIVLKDCYDCTLYLHLPGLWNLFLVYSLKQCNVQECCMLEKPRYPLVPNHRIRFLLNTYLLMNMILISVGTSWTSSTVHESSVS